MKTRNLPLLALPFALLAGCATMSSAGSIDSADVYRGLGTEPGWSVLIGGSKIEYLGNYGETAITVAKPRPIIGINGERYETPTLTVDITHGQCSDGMSDRIYADNVTVTAKGQTLRGCGGAILPVQQLAGTNWAIETLDGKALADGTRSNIVEFTPDRLSVRAGCNNMGGSYSVAGQTLKAGPMMATRMACAPELMAQDDTLNSLFAGPVQMEWRADGTLVLSGNGHRVVLRQAI